MRLFPVTRPTRAALIALTTIAISCRESSEPTAPTIDAARAVGDPTISSVVPDTAGQGVTLDVTVRGSGYDRGSAITLERDGSPAAGITTNTTTYVTSKQLIANITIAAEADTGEYDVAVTTSGGRKGVGIELFTVAYVIDELGIIGGTWSRAHAINDRGEVVGTSCTQDCLATAFHWSQAGGQANLGGLPGYSRSGAYAINSRGQVFGEVTCFMSDPGCGGGFRSARVRWQKVAGTWTISPVEGCSVVTPLGEGSEKFLINNRDQCVARSTSGLSLQTLSGTSVISTEPLPSPFPGDFLPQAYGLNDASMVAGSAVNTDLQRVPVVWHRNGSGAWTVLLLHLPGSDVRGVVIDISEPDGAGLVRATGFTEAGQTQADLVDRAVRWTLRGNGSGGWEITSTEVLPNGRRKASTNAWAWAVNTGGDVAGHVGAFVGSGSPVKWSAGGSIEELPASKGRAVDINDQGWIVGAVWDNNSRCDRAAIWRQQ